MGNGMRGRLSGVLEQADGERRGGSSMGAAHTTVASKPCAGLGCAKSLSRV